MKNMTKRIMSFLLACIIIFSVVPMAFAGNSYGEGTYPELTVKGFGASSVKIYYEDDPEQKSLFYPFDEERLKENLDNIDEYIIKSIEEGKPNILKTVIYNYIMDTMGMLALKPDGSNMDGVASEPVGLRKKGEGRYEFYYDCRESPAVSAHDLHIAINQLFEETGSEKIELIGSSFGANIVTAYMHEYKDYLDRIDTVLLCAPSVGGMQFLGQLFSGNFDVSPVGLCDFIDDMAEEQAISDFFYILEQTGVLKLLLKAVAVPVLRVAVYEGVADAAKDLLATMPTLCVCLPDEYFVPAMEFLYGENYKDPSHTYAKTIEKMIYYHYNIANRAAEIYLDAEKNNKELNMAIVCKFGVAAIPLSSGENTMDDGLVNLPVSSFGATCTTYGAKLPDDYKQQKYTEYNFMCPEWNIDASTCAFPFRTWFIKGLGHGKKISDYNDFIKEITKKDLDVFDDPNRPQYLKVRDDDPQMLEPLKAGEELDTSLSARLARIVKAVILLIKDFADKIFEKV